MSSFATFLDRTYNNVRGETIFALKNCGRTWSDDRLGMWCNAICLSFSELFSLQKKENNAGKRKTFIRKRPQKVHEVSSSTSTTSECEKRRNPRRGARVNYEEADVPDDDHYLCKFTSAPTRQIYLTGQMNFFIKCSISCRSVCPIKNGWKLYITVDGCWHALLDRHRGNTSILHITVEF